MKKYLFLLLISLFHISCNDEDSCNSFLECHNNSLWEINLGNFIVYQKFHTNKSNPIEEWLKFTNENCYWYFDTKNASIVKNHKNQLIIRIPSPVGNNEYRLLTFIENENFINLKLELFENSTSKGVENYVLNKSSFKPQNVQICSDN